MYLSPPVWRPETLRLLDSLVEALTADESCRPAAVEHVLRTCVPVVLSLLCERLVGRLGSGSPEVRRQAQSSLVQMGKPALPAVTYQLLHAPTGHEPVLLVETLTAIGAMLSPRERADLYLELAMARGGSTDAGFHKAVDQAITTLRQLDEGSSAARQASPRMKGPPA